MNAVGNQHGEVADRKAFICWGIFLLLYNILRDFRYHRAPFPLWCCSLHLRGIKASLGWSSGTVCTVSLAGCHCNVGMPLLSLFPTTYCEYCEGQLDKETSVIPRHILFNLMTITHYRGEQISGYETEFMSFLQQTPLSELLSRQEKQQEGASFWLHCLYCNFILSPCSC